MDFLKSRQMAIGSTMTKPELGARGIDEEKAQNISARKLSNNKKNNTRHTKSIVWDETNIKK